MTDRARVEELWSRFLAGESLPPEEEAEIADRLDADPRLLAELSRDLQLDRSLLGLGLVKRDEEAFMASFRYRLESERDASRFVATVKLKLKRPRKPPTRRWQSSSWTGARAGIAAAILLAFLGLLFAASTSGGRARKPDASVAAPRRPADRPEPPEVRRSEPEAPRSERPPAPVESPAPPPAPAPRPLPEKKEEPAAPPPASATAETRDALKPDPVRVTVGAPAPALVAAATLTRVNGEVIAGRTPVKTGQKLFAGQSLEAVGAKSGAQFLFADGTRVDLGADTLVSEISDARGKRILLARGVLNADVTKQPAEQPLIIGTPHGEAKVLGTQLRIAVEPGATRLDVKEGKVRLTRASDQKSVDVPAGCFVSAGAAGDFDLNSEHKLTLSFQDGVAPTPRYSGTSDTILSEAPKLADKNLGAANALWVDGDTTVGDDRYVLLRWDLTAIPARCTVLSATIEVQVTNDSRGNPFELYEVKRDWVEKEATWKSFAGKMAWQLPGAQGSQDRGTATLGMLAPMRAGAYSLPLTADGLAALQSWIDVPASNHGLVIANSANSDAVGFHSREAVVAANRPRLNITFVPRTKDASSK